MKRRTIFLLLAVLIFTVVALRPGRLTLAAAPAPQAQQAPTVASNVDREISGIEKQVVEAAEAMPDDKFNFSPESLHISGSDYKGVRTFAVLVKHIAAS